MTNDTIKSIILNALSKKDNNAQAVANSLNKPKEYVYRIIDDFNLSISEFIYICYVLKLEINSFISTTEQYTILYDKAESPYTPQQLEIMMKQKKTNEQDFAEIISSTKKEFVTPLEEELLFAFRDVEIKHGREAQINILNMIYKLT